MTLRALHPSTHTEKRQSVDQACTGKKQSTQGRGEDVRVEAKRALRPERSQNPWKRDPEDCGPEQTRTHRPPHAHLAVAQREHLRTVREGHGPLAGTVKRGEEVDEQRDQSEMRAGSVRDEEAEAGGEEGPGHLGEGEEEEGAAAVGVDGVEGGPGEDEVDQAEAEGGG